MLPNAKQVIIYCNRFECSNNITQCSGSPCGCPLRGSSRIHHYTIVAEKKYDAVHAIRHYYSSVNINATEAIWETVPAVPDHHASGVFEHHIKRDRGPRGYRIADLTIHITGHNSEPSD